MNRNLWIFLYRGALWASLLPLPVQALMEVKGGALLADFSASVEYTTNATNRQDGSSDTIVRAGPLLRYESIGAAVQTTASAGVEYLRYLQESEISDFNYQGHLEMSYPNGLTGIPYSMGVRLEMVQETNANSGIGRIERSTSYSAAANGSYRLGNRLSLSAAADYRLEEPDSADLAQTRSFGIPLGLSYIYSEDLSYSLGYRYRKTESPDLESNSNSTDHALYLSANGQLLPLVSGSISLGVQQRTEDDSGDEDVSPYASGSLDWRVSDLTTASLSVSSDFETTLANQSTSAMSVGVGLNHRFDDFWSARAQIALRETQYTDVTGSTLPGSEDRTDRDYTIGISLAYTINQQINVNLVADFTKNDSTAAEYTYDVFTIALSTSIPF